MYDTISMSICKEINCKEELNLKINGVGLTSSTISHTGTGSGKVRKSTGGSFSDNLGGFERDNEREQPEKKLKDIGYSKENPVLLNLVKLAHHGSKGNISKEFLEIIDCNDFLFTTNGGIGGAYHPDRKTIALIMECHEKKSTGKKVTLRFNYPLGSIMDRTAGLLSEDERKYFDIDDNINIINLVKKK